jgi:hypothetical protein
MAHGITKMPPFVKISGLNGAIPTTYDPAWQTYTDLSPAQIEAFKSFPQDLAKYIGVRRWNWELCLVSAAGPSVPYITLPSSAGTTIAGMQLLTDAESQRKIAALKQAIDSGVLVDQGQGFPFLAVNGVYMVSAADITSIYGYVVRWVQQTYSIAAQLLAQVSATPQQISSRSAVDSAFAAVNVK